MIIAVSDLHLGDPLSNRAGFIHFINEFLKPKSDDISHLILLGDVLDLWKRSAPKILLDNLDILNSISSLGFHVVYVVGNHDIIMTEYIRENQKLKVPEIIADSSTNITINKEFQISNGGKEFRFIHGHQINYWYALQFYETFSRAMCKTDEQDLERADVWTMITRLRDVSPDLQQKVLQLSSETRMLIENKLARPLESSPMSSEESIIVESNLLGPLIEIPQPSKFETPIQLVQSINELLQELNRSNNRTMKIKSLVDLSEITEEMTLEDTYARFLAAWKEIYKWALSRDGQKWKEEKKQIIQYTRRIAAMFTTELQHDEFLIHGHTHRNFVNQETHTADTGCWIRDNASYIMIEDGEVTGRSWI